MFWKRAVSSPSPYCHRSVFIYYPRWNCDITSCVGVLLRPFTFCAASSSSLFLTHTFLMLFRACSRTLWMFYNFKKKKKSLTCLKFISDRCGHIVCILLVLMRGKESCSQSDLILLHWPQSWWNLSDTWKVLEVLVQTFEMAKMLVFGELCGAEEVAGLWTSLFSFSFLAHHDRDRKTTASLNVCSFQWTAVIKHVGESVLSTLRLHDLVLLLIIMNL